jgi:pyruvate dehydrogenase E2 component (dihydrolipoamide acetyltransferase)
MTAPITKLGIPKWGMSMTEGKLVGWLVEEGTALAQGDPVAEVETEKINGVVEAPAAGVLRRKVAALGDQLPVGAMIGVIADASVPDAEIDAFVADFKARFVPGATAEDEGGAAPSALTVRDRTVSFVKEGTGEDAVVLLHGFGGESNNWLFNQSALAKGRTVYALDLPGHGRSSKDAGSGDLEEFGRVVLDAMTALGVERAHLAGHSMGGGIAMTCALLEPARVRSLVLISPIGFGPEINREFIDGFVSAASRRDVQRCLEMLFADPARVTRQLVNEVLRYKRIDGVERALATVAERLFPEGRQRTILAGRFAGSTVPMLVIWGRRDRIIPVEHTAAAPPHARVEIVEDAGHSPQMEASGEVNRLIGTFLTER